MKLFNVRIRAKTVMVICFAMDFYGWHSQTGLTAEISSELEMSVYNDFRSS